ncbi:MAG: hypothetical protein ACYCPQ_04205 [Elusimicrobiota bacterium]
MKQSRRIERLDVRRFLQQKILIKLTSDLRRDRIFSEADLQSCIYYHLRCFLRSDNRWIVLNKAYIKGLSTYPDFLLKRNGVSRIAIELKEKRNLKKKDWFLKDLRKLQKLCRRSSRTLVGYFICLVRSRSEERDLQQQAEDWRKKAHRRHIFPVIINAYNRVNDRGKFDSTWKMNAKTNLHQTRTLEAK